MEAEKLIKISLVRHFEVNCWHKLLMSSEDFREWVSLYNCSPTKAVDLLTVVKRYNVAYATICYLKLVLNQMKSVILPSPLAFQNIYGRTQVHMPKKRTK